MPFLPGRMPFLPPNQQRQSTEAKQTADGNTHTHPFNGPLSGTTRVSRYQKGKPNWTADGNMKTKAKVKNLRRTGEIIFVQLLTAAVNSSNVGCVFARPKSFIM